MGLPIGFALALALIWFVLIPLRFLRLRQGHKHRGEAIKGFCTLIAAGFAAWGCFRVGWRDSYAVMVFAALVVCALADVVLDYAFVAGGVVFFCGHVLYVAAFFLREPPKWWSFVLIALACAVLFVCLFRYRDRIPHKLLVCVLVYGVALSALMGMAITLAVVVRSVPAVLGALGACLFFSSDVTLGHCMLDERDERWHALCLRQYYAGQMLLALSAHATLLL